MKKMLLRALGLGTALMLAAGSAGASETASRLIEEARQQCASLDGGELGYQPSTVRLIDLNGDGVDDEIIDESTYSCTSSKTLFCGTGGCGLKVIVGDRILERLVKQWQTLEWDGDRMLLLQLHGAECGGSGLERCYEAVSWGDGDFRSVRPSR
ncbi:hypothetical protein GCM10011348_00670 [Marinobacterium nitratireducens]|uniref:Uncharacterized protein n=1 Tax=Marinobacterium nitratireducens TaxID=518897 RepID=A0A918DMJ7_9GAMM|nr:hypothetical protein [Marinobacterium nitratireducens]GGO75571.1 hypothetical protein GCM10011348_00670 [Marinobacterium nitratireducens]